ncbi:MAG: MepB family protein [Gammaproteobacteria bacterium]|nr:MepB family protein [Gammaproteobacteria bacterium]
MIKEIESRNHPQSFLDTGSIHNDLLAVIDLVYIPFKLICSQPVFDAESIEYGACDFKLNQHAVKFRVAKITPTKIGQFVTLWKRSASGPIQPYDISDPIDLYIISTRKGNHFGQFVFPKSELCKQGVLSINGKGGKRAMRVYPPWDKVVSKQAQNTQNWQIKYFLEIPENKKVEVAMLEKLYR